MRQKHSDLVVFPANVVVVLQSDNMSSSRSFCVVSEKGRKWTDEIIIKRETEGNERKVSNKGFIEEIKSCPLPHLLQAQQVPARTANALIAPVRYDKSK